MEDDSQIFSESATKKQSIVPGIIVGVLIGGLLFLAIWIFVWPKLKSGSAAEVVSEPVKDEKTLAEESAMTSCQYLVNSKYPGWEIKGSDLDISELSNSENIKFQMHISKGPTNRVLTIVLKRFMGTNGEKYWLAYQPTTLQLGELELKNIHDAEIEAIDDWDPDEGRP